MAVMEFHKANYINTTSLIAVQANQTGTVAYLFDKNRKVGFGSVGYNSTTATTITVTFSPAKIVSHIFLQGHNLKDFNIYANTTTNVLFSTTSNSATSTYLGFSSQTVSTVVLTMNDTIAGSVEKALNELVITERQYQFERNPSIDDFNYTIARKQVKHEMPDGGTALFNIRDKYKAKLKLTFFSQTSHDSLFSIYDAAMPVYFLPFPTTTGWNGQAFPCVWHGDFNFRYSTNVKTPGFSGEINLAEEPAG